MKKILLLIALVAGGLITINAQMNEYVVTFEAESDTAGWLVFANGSMPADDDVTVVANPDTTGINPSEMALRFVVNADADPWAGMVNNNKFTGDSAFVITEENHIFTMMVYKTTLSNVGLKLEQETSGAGGVYEVLVPNTLVNEWELLTFDFSGVIGNTYEALVIFPDFPEMRTQGTVVYIDNIMFGEGPATSVNLFDRMTLKVYPNPAESHLYLQHPGMTGYTISNSLGQKIETMNFNVTDQKMIELDKLKSGIHFITVQSQSGIQTTRFIKK